MRYRIFAVIVAVIAPLSFAVFVSPGSGAQSDGARLPWDFPLPPLDFMLFQTGPTNGRPPESNGNTAPPMAMAERAAHTALADCHRDGLKVGVAVIDSAGDLRTALTSDGVPPGKVYIATRKALAALAFEVPTSRIAAVIKAHPAERTRMRPDMAGFPGAVPLIANGRLEGAIGVGGASAAQDEACAAAGAQILDRAS